MYKFIIFYLCFFFNFSWVFSQDIEEAELSGAWYPSDPRTLSRQINEYLEAAEIPPLGGEVVAFICPHAGIIYSGDVAAYGFKAALAKKIDTVIVVGFSHRMNYPGVAVFDKDGFRTPLGVLYTDKTLVGEITTRDKIFPDSSPFKGENSIELILPFIQIAFKDSKALLLAMGEQSFQNTKNLGQALYEILKGKDNFIIIASTDMSHFLSLSEAQKVDSSTADLIIQNQPEELFSACINRNRMCGTGAVVATMIAAKKLGADRVVVLKQSTSAKASYDTQRVVGYLSAAFIKENGQNPKESENMKELLSAQQRKELLKLARDTIRLYLTKGEVLKAEVSDPKLKEVRGVFVTLHKGHNLRGCIGNIIGTKPLYIGVRDMAIASATDDPRFAPVTESELKDISIEISVLSPLKRITNPDEIILGVHGVLVKSGWQSGVYLPQVATETGWDKEQFMNSLCAHKAGLPASAWKTGQCEIYVFTAEVFGE